MKTKYPRTEHLSFSESLGGDDILGRDDIFLNKNIVVTEKLCGECSTFYHDGYSHARSLDSKHHPSRSFFKTLVSEKFFLLPYGYRVCGENVYAKHSIFYDKLSSYFYIFAIYDDNNFCLSWDDTEFWAEELKIPTVPVLYRGIWNEDKVKALIKTESKFGKEKEGFVVRLENGFTYEDHSVRKFVRKNHVQTSNHWMNEEIVKNKLDISTK